MKRFYLIQYIVSNNDTDIKEIIKSLGDWFNYFNGSFLLFSSLNIEAIYDRIKKEKPDEHILVLEFNLKNYYGWLPKAAWDWLKEKKSKQLK
jgi:hypothetical protein